VTHLLFNDMFQYLSSQLV